MDLPYIKLYKDLSGVIDMLSDTEAGRLFKALMHYINGVNEELPGQERLIFAMIKAQVDRDAANYQGFLDKQRENGKKGGRPKTQPNPMVLDENPNNPSLFEKTQITQEKEKEEEDKKKNKPPKPPKGENAAFEAFWLAYPRHTNKQAASKAFERLNPDEALMTTMLTAIETQRRSDQWTRDGGQFIPHPATWLNGRRWEDEMPRGGKTVSVQRYEQRNYTEDELLAVSGDLLKEVREKRERGEAV